MNPRLDFRLVAAEVIYSTPARCPTALGIRTAILLASNQRFKPFAFSRMISSVVVVELERFGHIDLGVLNRCAKSRMGSLSGG